MTKISDRWHRGRREKKNRKKDGGKRERRKKEKIDGERRGRKDREDRR